MKVLKGSGETSIILTAKETKKLANEIRNDYHSYFEWSVWKHSELARLYQAIK